MSFRDNPRIVVLGAVAAIASALTPSCGGETAGSEGTDGVTHWLDVCVDDGDCGGLECLCGVCTRPCEDASACEGLDTAAVCAIPDGCDGAEGRVCLLPSDAGGAADGGGAGGSAKPGVKKADKVDLLLMIDNSISMADKQEILGASVPSLVDRLINPVCVDPDTGAQSPAPSSPDASCPAPLVREFAPVRDLHVGIVTSALGSYGTDACVPEGQDPEYDEERNDHGHLLGARPRALAAGLGLATDAEGTPGFLKWDGAGGGQDAVALGTTFQELVTLAGEKGCGYEASLEAWYRFLVDPNPPQQIVTVMCPNSATHCAQAQGTDQELLAQRKAFLRPDSLLTVVMLSDENDCSVQATGTLTRILENVDMPRASSTCAVDPNDPCCYSCGDDVPAGCSADASCDGSTVPAEQDSRNLRCWNDKRRFGKEFLYPVERYVNALTQRQLCPEVPGLSSSSCASPVQNPIYADLSGGGGPVRDPSLVVLAGIIGVPWHDIAADVDEQGRPLPLDTNGDGTVDLVRFLTARQLNGTATDGVRRDKWGEILGMPEASPPVPPLDPLMIESLFPRSGTNPATGQALAPPSAGLLANPVNGHEWDILDSDDLQYACIFPLATPRDCLTAYPDHGCDCLDGESFPVDAYHKPVCQDASGAYSHTQRYAKAYPGLRQLQVLRDLGDNGVVTSICSANTTEPTAQAYGYRPSIAAIIDRMKRSLAE